MSLRLLSCLSAASVVFASAPLLAQSTVNYAMDGPSLATAGAPFQAERVTTTTQRIDDGSVLRREEHELISRDGEGRVLVESFQTSAPENHFFVLADPTTHHESSWNTMRDNGTTQFLGDKTHLQVAALERDRSDRMPQKADTNTTFTELGSKTVAGVECMGKKTVNVIPAKTIGNDHDLQRSEEVWTSKDLQLVVAETDTSAISGTRTVTTAWLKREAPPSDRFVVPSRVTLKNFTLSGVRLGTTASDGKH